MKPPREGPAPGEATQLPHIPAGGSGAPTPDLYSRTVSASRRSQFIKLPFALVSIAGLAAGGFLALGPGGVFLGLVVAFVVDNVVTMRFLGSAYSYARIREPMLRELGEHYQTDFSVDWRVGFARGVSRQVADSGFGRSDSEDFGFLRMTDVGLDFYGSRLSFTVPKGTITCAGNTHCPRARMLGLSSLSARHLRPYITYTSPTGEPAALNFVPMDGPGVANMLAKGEVLGDQLAAWLASGRQ